MVFSFFVNDLIISVGIEGLVTSTGLIVWGSSFIRSEVIIFPNSSLISVGFISIGFGVEIIFPRTEGRDQSILPGLIIFPNSSLISTIINLHIELYLLH